LYIYANGLFKAKSTTILGKKEYETLISSDDELFFQLLRNYGFGFSRSIEKLYCEEIKRLKRDLFDALDNLEELKLFFAQFDLLNTKLIYKQITQDIEVDDYLIDCGNLSPLAIYNALKNKDYKELGKEKEIFIKINELENLSLTQTNFQIDKIYHKYYQKLVAQQKPFSDYLLTKLDLTNILALIRIKALNLGEQYLIDSLYLTNTLPKEKLLELFNLPLNEMINQVANLGYGSVARSLNEYRLDNDLELLEVNLERNLYELLIDYSFMSKGLGFIMIYVFQKLMELKNVKVIYYNRTTSLARLFVLE
jgi:vacuolar-type H+-ATPase subunit C/Vma6